VLQSRHGLMTVSGFRITGSLEIGQFTKVKWEFHGFVIPERYIVPS
jgi:hypothetical protein